MYYYNIMLVKWGEERKGERERERERERENLLWISWYVGVGGLYNSATLLN